MDKNEFLTFANRISAITKELNEMNVTLSRLKIDRQLVLEGNGLIPAGTACKITYDNKGLVRSGEPLSAGDIPPISIDQVDGLRNIINQKQDIVEKEEGHIHQIQAGTGIRINYNEDGLVTSSSDQLLIGDVPDLPMEKIVGLNDQIHEILEQLKNLSIIEDLKKISRPGTYTKVQIDEYGNVLKGTQITLDDIPLPLITKINLLESRIPTLASQSTLTGIQESLNRKLNANPVITPGTYTKVQIDEKGLVVLGDHIKKEDLPTFYTDDIVGLDSALRGKADQSTVVELMNAVSSLGTTNNTSEVLRLSNEVKTKGSKEELRRLENRIDWMQEKIDRVNEIPTEMITTKLDDIVRTLNDLTNRVRFIETQLKTR